MIREIKKGPQLQQVNHKLLETLHPERVAEIEDQAIEESELDEMWSFVGRKRNQRWLWHALDRRSGQVLAYVFGRRKDEVFLELKQLLEGFGIQKFCSDGWGAYESPLCPEVHELGKPKTQQIEHKHLRLRTRLKRLARRTLCYSRSEEMHDIVIELFINRYEFGNAI